MALMVLHGVNNPAACLSGAVCQAATTGRPAVARRALIPAQSEPGASQYHSSFQVKVSGPEKLWKNQTYACASSCSLVVLFVVFLLKKICSDLEKEGKTAKTHRININDEEFQAFTRTCKEFQPACRWK